MPGQPSYQSFSGQPSYQCTTFVSLRDECYEENYDFYEDEMREDTLVKQLEDILKNHDYDTHVNTIKLLTDGASSTSRCILDFGSNHHIFTDESWLEANCTRCVPQPSCLWPLSMLLSWQNHKPFL